MSTAEELYARIADGSFTDPVPREHLRPVQTLARRAVLSPDRAAREGALRAARALGISHGLAVALELVRDPDPKLRRDVLHLAIGAQADGLAILRRLAEDPDPDIGYDALELLAGLVDGPSVALSRRLLSSPDARIRATAVELL